MDICSIHNIDKVTELIQQTGAVVDWLPLYCPDCNTPIEEVFSKAKNMMKAMEVEMQVVQDCMMHSQRLLLMTTRVGLQTVVYTSTNVSSGDATAFHEHPCERWSLPVAPKRYTEMTQVETSPSLAVLHSVLRVL